MCFVSVNSFYLRSHFTPVLYFKSSIGFLYVEMSTDSSLIGVILMAKSYDTQDNFSGNGAINGQPDETKGPRLI